MDIEKERARCRAKSLAYYYKHKDDPDFKAKAKERRRAWYLANKGRVAIKAKAWKANNEAARKQSGRRYNTKRRADPSTWRRDLNSRLKSVYGITVDKYEALYASQGGKCAICKRAPSGRREVLCIDHCHSSDIIRGLLCIKCNTAVGMMDDSPIRLRDAAGYLEMFNALGPPVVIENGRPVSIY